MYAPKTTAVHIVLHAHTVSHFESRNSKFYVQASYPPHKLKGVGMGIRRGRSNEKHSVQ